MKFSSRSRKPALNITTSRARRQSRPRNRKRKLRRASCSSMPNRKSPTTPKTASTSFASRRPPANSGNGILNDLQRPCNPHEHPLYTPYENPPNMGFPKSNFIFPKSNFTIHRTPTGAAERKFIRILPRHFDCAPRIKCGAHLQLPRNSCRRFNSSLTAQGANPETGDSGGKATGAIPPFSRTGKTGIYADNPAKNPVAGLRQGNVFRPR